MVFFQIPIGALVITTRTKELKVTADVDAVLGIELEEDKLAVTV